MKKYTKVHISGRFTQAGKTGRVLSRCYIMNYKIIIKTMGLGTEIAINMGNQAKVKENKDEEHRKERV